MSLFDQYLDQAKKLLPQGVIWTFGPDSKLASLLGASAARLADVHIRAEKLAAEAVPSLTSELLPEWEEMAGLPDGCGGGDPALTVTERQEAVIEKLTSRGGLSLARFLEMARWLGYDVEIVEYYPFTCGRSRCGGTDVLGHRSARLYWRVKVKSPRAHWFKAGRNRCGERLGWASRAMDLECYFNRRKPAHTIIWFEYQEYA